MADYPELIYQGKRSTIEILEDTPEARLEIENGSGSGNLLICADNLPVLKTLHSNGTQVDLIYIDPPFATNALFNFGDTRANTVSRSARGEVAYCDRLSGSTYLEFLRERFIFLKLLLTERGSIYIHTDSKVGAYVRVIADEIFGRENFRNEITRVKCNPKNFQRRAFGNMKDLILFYSLPTAIWNEPHEPFTSTELKRLFSKKDHLGRYYTTIPLHAPGETVSGPTGEAWRGMFPPQGRHWRTEPSKLEELDRNGLIEWSSTGVPRKKIYAHESKGKRVQDIWEFKDPQYPSYPTEKRLDLLRFIIQVSSNPGSVVLDCFCGSASTLKAADDLGRRWIGIDESETAIRVARKRLEGRDYGFAKVASSV